ncbi:MAG: hypothetical protein OH316_02010 [Candidatus Parvarchaeota archaeon]|nr:hypothetical protein [Candidatus Parvarchaeota archaeon]MCW1301887.1 hypothetical protein [Candidatus Parvarchaeota archaeon]
MDGEEELGIGLLIEQLNAVSLNAYLLRSALETTKDVEVHEKAKLLSSHISKINSDLEKIRVLVKI